eukprot:TRINITY_DN10417_c0_g1_i2.p1 TRINITY_DN10417_c0_g1~~TRINITY_DN10417_c0_g1_i2.p1  ORF type:complete len:238 (-),score=34.13 TRINITY_DN10417_c0_g1_i2:133-846(-)
MHATCLTKMSSRVLGLYNCLIWGFGKRGFARAAVSTFLKLLEDEMRPDKLSFAGILSACEDLTHLRLGKQLHCLSVKFGFACNIPVSSSLVAMYAKRGRVRVATRLFQETAVYHLDVFGYAKSIFYNGRDQCFRQISFRKGRHNFGRATGFQKNAFLEKDISSYCLSHSSDDCKTTFKMFAEKVVFGSENGKTWIKPYLGESYESIGMQGLNNQNSATYSSTVDDEATEKMLSYGLQ